MKNITNSTNINCNNVNRVENHNDNNNNHNNHNNFLSKYIFKDNISEHTYKFLETFNKKNINDKNDNNTTHNDNNTHPNFILLNNDKPSDVLCWIIFEKIFNYLHYKLTIDIYVIN